MIEVKVSFTARPKGAPGAGVLWVKQDDNTFRQVLKKAGYQVSQQLLADFQGKRDEVLELFCPGGDAKENLVLLGVGPHGNLDNIRRAGGNLAAITNKRKLSGIWFVAPPGTDEELARFLEGIVLGGYTYDRYKAEKSAPQTLEVALGSRSTRRKEAVRRAIVFAEATCFARDLINTPANDLTPVRLSQEAIALARRYGIRCEAFGPAQLRRWKMGALLGVAAGSENEPRLIHWRYTGGRRASRPIILVGKGVTFDSGGISLKPAEGMQEMKNDMSGAAVVVALMVVLARLRPRINVMGIAPCVENMPSGKALKPGDIVTAADGQTIEIISTDAEGRLILADALVYARRWRPKAIIDIATLTGAIQVALGNIAAGVMGNNDELVQALYDAGQRSGERIWRLPLWDDYQEQLKSEVADMKNSGGRPAGAITAACFIAKFVKDTPWAHIDIAGVDNQDKPHPYIPRGGTGFGVRLLAEYLTAGNHAKIPLAGPDLSEMPANRWMRKEIEALLLRTGVTGRPAVAWASM